MAKLLFSHVPTSTLPCLLKAIESESAIYLYDPNTLGREIASGVKSFGPTCASSELSGAPGYVYLAEGVSLRLTGAEIARLTAHRLTPEEYAKLRAAHGIFFEIHKDFYNDDGRAIMPHAMAT